MSRFFRKLAAWQAEFKKKPEGWRSAGRAHIGSAARPPEPSGLIGLLPSVASPDYSWLS